ncbi:elongation of very long chain fatty acids protein 6 [Uranotaenia lowii]|uniref:elongation of very long chain fatty acids protein 6 n=1 Tax=Uranotaenia lowii TaxID=190385 RepID=UPI0024798A50|nr:elongation of very long chain fatty acids protein 6 [Uranotaenia lowii]XP_055603686.1 elongation of very long chain fatty acids protein 6 [Uranotaenia lowii]XP_055603687.1 elongation of very long chain fatty acids protein 6 [Uranotaenia lowii]XP_055603688.1 elongation of very long chain fatty acids protein 6 [Uranotaenia lowii]XP_055603689.1 elongation of very long chain fatty acids protein 6 [Uranotaenia lowii]
MNVEITPNYSYIFDFENEFIHQDTRVWMVKNWHYVFYYCGIYMAVIFGGQHLMQNRPRFELRGLLAIWNSLLAMFSIMGACRTAPELFHVLRHYGLFHSCCVPSFIEHDRVSGFWTWLFVLSKLPELGDTVFIVLRKQPLIFLHWYHHITVLIYSWFSYTEYTASARWFVVMNYCVHSVMYTYYALRALNYKPPRSIAMIITASQLTQMVVGCAINVWAHGFLQTAGKGSCHISELNIKLSIAMYFSYFVLFARFFYKTYLSTDARKGKRPAQVTASSTGGSVEYSSSISSKHGTGAISAKLLASKAPSEAQYSKMKAQ